MKFSLAWLRDHLETGATAAEIAAKLNAIGLEVEGLEDPAEKLAGFRVARVLTAAPHPQADKLQVLTVDAGDGQPLQVVCGAPNARAGLVGVLGVAGAIVPANGMELRKSAIRGVESNGMMCSSRELELGDDHAGIIELPADAPVGTTFAEYRGTSPVFDVAVTPNRPDCMGVHGIARDLAAAGMGTLRALGLRPSTSSGRAGVGGVHGTTPVQGATPAHDAAPVHGAIAAHDAARAHGAAAAHGELVEPGPGTFPCPVEIRIDDPEGCPAFYGRVIRGVRNGPSPEWLQALLRDAGQRPISALVDLTNYLMLGFGRPAHVYDLAKLTGAVVARRAEEGEQVLALNEKTYTLTPAMTVIADDAGVHDVAGIMGGEHSGVSEGTTDVLLEIAYFDPERIGATGRALGLASDARTRFERGVDPAFLEPGLELLTALIIEICGGEASEVVRAGNPPMKTATVAYDPALALRLGGVEIPAGEQRAILEGLGFSILRQAQDERSVGAQGERGVGAQDERASGAQDERAGGARDERTGHVRDEREGSWTVTAPTWRPDVDGAPDLVEEVVRIHGLDRVASVPLVRADGVARPTATAAQALERRLRRAAAARGLNEAVTWSFLPENEANHFLRQAQDERGGGGLWVLENPISEDMKAMRPSLLPGLLSAARRNLDRGADGVRLFEIGRRYLRGEAGASDERLSLAVLLAGEKTSRGWATGKAAGFDAFDGKAEALALLAAAGAPVDKLQVMGEAGPQFHPGQSATLRLGPKTVLARFGALHPATLSAFDIDGSAVAVELFLDAIPAGKGSGFARPGYAPPPLQAVRRDFAFLVPAEMPAGDLLRAVKGADKANIVDARLFDLFAGQGVPEGRKSLAIEITLQPADKSYTDDDLKAVAERVVGAASKLGAELRS